MVDRVQHGPSPAAALMIGANALPVYCFAGLLTLSLFPVLLTPIPAMLDYPNHLARMYLLSRGGAADAHPHYQVVWALYPNLAMDLLVPRFAKLMSIESATRLFLLLAQLLVISGSVAVEWSVKRRFEFAGFAALLFLYSMPFAWGFVNFQFGLGLALWGIAAWIALARRSLAVRFAVHCLVVAALFTAHFFALGIYGFTLGIIELWAAWSRKSGIKDLLAIAALLAFPAVVLIGVMVWLAGSVGSAGTDWLPELKPRWVFSVLSGYNLPLSFVGMTVLIGVVYVLARHGMLRLEHAGQWLAAAFALLYLAMPGKLLDTAHIDVRVIVAAALILPGFASLSVPSIRWKQGLASVVVGLTLLNLADISRLWMSYRSEYAAMIASFDEIEPRSRVLIGHSTEEYSTPQELRQYPLFHAPTLAVHYADAFVPNLFTGVGKQPIEAGPAVRHLDLGWVDPAPLPFLRAAIGMKGAANAAGLVVPPFIRHWPRDFEYLYLLGPSHANPLPELLFPVSSGSQFVLYRIRRKGT